MAHATTINLRGADATAHDRAPYIAAIVAYTTTALPVSSISSGQTHLCTPIVQEVSQLIQGTPEVVRRQAGDVSLAIEISDLKDKGGGGPYLLDEKGPL